MNFEWEDLAADTRRAKVFGGWIVTVGMDDGSGSSIFVSDPHYQWSINDDEEKS